MFASLCFSQKPIKIYTADIGNFWTAYDSIKTTSDTVKQLGFIQKLYLDKASAGLKDFMLSRKHSAARHLSNIKRYPQFWESIRPKTKALESLVPNIEKVFKRYKKIYPKFNQPEIYFTVGVLNSGGTTSPDRILIGSEIACGDKNTNASELNNWLADVFKLSNGVVALVAHEIGHTQQSDAENNNVTPNLLGYCLREGMCDFLAELTYQKISAPYMVYGRDHKKELWRQFQKEMLGQETKNWLYNGSDAPNGVADLGYFIGYEICRSYYENAKNKKKAIVEIIELKYDPQSVAEFLAKSGFAG